MRNRKRIQWTAVILAVMLLLSLSALADEAHNQVAGEGDMTTVEEVGVDGLIPVYASDIDEGTYEAAVECSSSMFRIGKAEVNVSGGAMTLALTMEGTGYELLYPGTAAEAAAASADAYIGYTENEEGKQVYVLPLEALDSAFSCAAFSVKKQMWYDRNLLVRADSLPAEAIHAEIADYEALEDQARQDRIDALQQEGGDDGAATISVKDGKYAVDVSLEGGSGKADVTSPATLLVEDGKAHALIEWSSPNYDYMIVNGQQYLPVNQSGNSVFEIPVTVFDEPMTVTADTTAMSTPHEIEYTLTFDSDSIGNSHFWVWILMAAVIVAAVCVLALRGKNRKERKSDE